MTIVEVLFHAVHHATTEDIVLEAIRVDYDHITVSDFMLEHICHIGVITASAALEGEVVRLLLGGSTEVALERVVGQHVEQSVTRITQIRSL